MLRIAQRIPELRVMVNTILTSLWNVASIFLLLFLVLFIYACIGMSLFGRVRYGQVLNSTFNFEDFGNSLVVLVYVLFGMWADMEYDCTVAEPK